MSQFTKQRKWVEDNLHDLIGQSEDTTVSYLISLAQQASSVARLKQTVLGDNWLPPENKNSSIFVEKLYTEFA